MNASLRKVLQEFLTGFLIIELNTRRARIRSRCLGTKRVPGRSRLALFRCHTANKLRERERERERDRSRQALINKYTKKRKEWYVYMKNAWSCDVQQRNPTSIMHETLWECKWDAMHEHIGSFKQNPTQKFHKNLINFEKPQKSFKNQKPMYKCVKCMKNERLEKHTRGKT